METADIIKALQNKDIARKIRLKDIPVMSPEEQQAWRDELERKEVAKYKAKRAKTFMQQRSIYNEQNVLAHEFKNIEPTSDEFVKLAKQAKQIALDYCNGKQYNTVLRGKAGTGKTMLSVCMLNLVRKHAIEPKSCLFVSTAEIAELSFAKYQHDFRREDRFNQFFKDLKETDLLVLDDLGTESSLQGETREASNTVQQTMFRIGDLMQGKPIIITTNNTGDDLIRIYNQKIVSRLLTSNPEHVLDFSKVPDYRMAHN